MIQLNYSFIPHLLKEKIKYRFLHVIIESVKDGPMGYKCTFLMTTMHTHETQLLMTKFFFAVFKQMELALENVGKVGQFDVLDFLG